MRDQRRYLAIALVVGCTGGADLRADCEGGPVFPDTLIASDKNTLSWTTSLDVDYLKGDVVNLPSYTAWLRGSLTQATALDISNDHPVAGQCAFYLVKLTGPPCGSWQSSAGTEPLRDVSIRPPCSIVAPSDEGLETAVQGGLQIAPNPWGDQNDARVFLRHVQAELGCTVDVPEQSTDSLSDAVPPWNPNEYYCGLDFSVFALELPSGPCLNHACYEHDVCYFESCASEPAGTCAFSPRSGSTGCDVPLVNTACDPGAPPPAGCLQADGLRWRVPNKLVCMVSEHMTVDQSINPLCQTVPCHDAGVCDASSGLCFSPVGLWPAEGDATDCIGSNDGALIGGVSFGPGAPGLGQAFRFASGVDDYVEIPHAPALSLVDAITIEGWVKPQPRLYVWKRLMDRNSGYGFRIQANQLVGTVFARFDHIASATIPSDVFTHVAWTYDRVAGESKLYVNAAVIGVEAHTDAITTNTVPLWVGRARFQSGVQDGVGMMDDIAIWSRALTQEDIQAIVTSGHNEDCP